MGHYAGYRLWPGGTLRPLHDLGLSLEAVQNITWRLTIPLGETGVQFFFVISGYLITQLLGAEEQRTGGVSLLAFYIRRFFRIVPAFAVYLAFVWVLRHFKMVQLDNEAFLRSATYLCNVSEFKCSWWLAHTWSLGVEEQFYIAWPLVFILVPREFRPSLMIGVLITLLTASVIVVELGPFANIAVGALLALKPNVRRWINRVGSPFVVWFVIFIIFSHPLIARAPVGFVMPLFVGFVFSATIDAPGPMHWLLLARPVQMLGLISYSAYLWQQISTAPFAWGGQETGAATLYSVMPTAAWVFLIPAIVSYFLIEAPAQRIGRWLSERIKSSRTQSVSYVSRDFKGEPQIISRESKSPAE